MSNSQTSEETSFRPAQRQPEVGSAILNWIESSPWLAFSLLTMLYFVTVFVLSGLKLLWLDELITLHIAKLASIADIWRALALGADPNPPVTHVLVHLSRLLFGDHEFAYRLPAMIGYWVGLLALFSYLRPRLPATWAVGGTVLSMTMAAFDYSYESRSYGIFYGLAMLAFFCWTVAASVRSNATQRRMALLGTGLALALGISTNYFAVLAFLPIGMGECTRTLVRLWSSGSRRGRLLASIDWGVWFVMLLAATPLIAYRPLIARSIAQFAPYAWNKVSLQQVADSYTQMVEIILYPLLAILLLGLILWIGKSRRASRTEAASSSVNQSRTNSADQRAWMGLPVHEAVGVFGLMAYPFLGYIVASVRGGMLSPRFVIPVCYGFAIAGTFTAFWIFGSMRRSALIFLCFLLAWFASREGVVGYWYHEQKDSFYKLLDRLPEADASVPQPATILIPDPLLALTFQHYAPAAASNREVFAVDFPAIRAYRGDDSPEENLWAGRNAWYSLKIMTVADFRKTTESYLVIAGTPNWYLEDLHHHGYTYRRLPIESRADDMGGFTPLARGTPEFYTADWLPLPGSVHQIGFRPSDEIPSARSLAGAGQ